MVQNIKNPRNSEEVLNIDENTDYLNFTKYDDSVNILLKKILILNVTGRIIILSMDFKSGYIAKWGTFNIDGTFKSFLREFKQF